MKVKKMTNSALTDSDSFEQKLSKIQEYVKSIKTDVMRELQSTREHFQTQVDKLVDQMTGQETQLKT